MSGDAGAVRPHAPEPMTREERRATAGESARPVLLFFHSPRSGRCRRVEGFLAQVLQRRHNHDTFAIHRIDCDRRPDLAARLCIESLPTLVVLESKTVQSRLEEPGGCREIADFLAPWLRPNSADSDEQQ